MSESSDAAERSFGTLGFSFNTSAADPKIGLNHLIKSFLRRSKLTQCPAKRPAHARQLVRTKTKNEKSKIKTSSVSPIPNTFLTLSDHRLLIILADIKIFRNAEKIKHACHVLLRMSNDKYNLCFLSAMCYPTRTPIPVESIYETSENLR